MIDPKIFCQKSEKSGRLNVWWNDTRIRIWPWLWLRIVCYVVFWSLRARRHDERLKSKQRGNFSKNQNFDSRFVALLFFEVLKIWPWACSAPFLIIFVVRFWTQMRKNAKKSVGLGKNLFTLEFDYERWHEHQRIQPTKQAKASV